MTQLTGPLVAEIATWLSIVSQLYSTRMEALLRPHGLTLGQFSILHHIARQRIEGGNRISDIAAAVEVQQPAVTKAVAKFSVMGLVEIEQDSSDKRARSVIARPEAAQLLDTIYKGIGPDLFGVFQSIDEDHRESFAEQLRHLGKWLDQNRITDTHGADR